MIHIRRPCFSDPGKGIKTRWATNFFRLTDIMVVDVFLVVVVVVVEVASSGATWMFKVKLALISPWSLRTMHLYMPAASWVGSWNVSPKHIRMTANFHILRSTWRSWLQSQSIDNKLKWKGKKWDIISLVFPFHLHLCKRKCKTPQPSS